eukprot:14556291-Ditylum_brightwellii.AAC.1
MNDFKVITDKFCLLIKSSCDSTPDHNICWPQHSPDPVFQTQQNNTRDSVEILWSHHDTDSVSQLKQADLSVDCYVDIQLTTTNSKDSLQQTSQSMQRTFDPGRITSYFSSTQDVQQKQTELHNKIVERTSEEIHSKASLTGTDGGELTPHTFTSSSLSFDDCMQVKDYIFPPN